jgi:hypothetical protein
MSLKQPARYLALALLSAIYLYPFVRAIGNGPDSGIFLNGAAMVAQGAIPSRDFIEPTGPGSFLWLGLFFHLFGTNFATAHALLLATGVALTLLVFHLGRLFPALFVLVMLIPLLAYNNPHYDSLVLVLAAFSVFLIAWWKMLDDAQSQPYALLAAAGVLAGLASCFLQQEGFLLAIALAASLLCLRRIKAVAVLIIAYAAVLAVLFTGFAFAHALPDLLYANYLRPLKSYGNTNAAPYGYPVREVLRPIFQLALNSSTFPPIAVIETAALTMPFLLVMAMPLLPPLAAMASRLNPLKPRLLPYWLAAYALWVSELYRLDIGHLRNGCVLLAVLFFSICETSSARWLQPVALAGIICVAFGGASQFAAALDSNRPMQTRRGIIYAEKPEPVIQYLEAHTKPGDNIFVYPYQPIQYFLNDLRNPTRYHCLVYGYNSDAEFNEAISALERNKVRYVLFDNEFSGDKLKRVFPAFRQPDAAHLLMEPYLAAHYREVDKAGRFTILERRN